MENFAKYKETNDIVIFEQKLFYYKFNLLFDRIFWYGTKAVKKKKLINFEWLRQVKPKKYNFYRLDTFFKVTFPLIYKGLLAGAALVFLSTMKELPQTLLLRPTGFSTMAVDIWSYASEALFTQAAFSGFILLAISAFPTYILSTRNLDN